MREMTKTDSSIISPHEDINLFIVVYLPIQFDLANIIFLLLLSTFQL